MHMPNGIIPGVQRRALNPPMSTEELSRTLRTSNITPRSLQETKLYVQDARYNLSRLNECIDRLCAERDFLSKDVSLYSSLHSPIRKLPPELLHSIFTFACEKNRYHPPVSLGSMPSVALSVVCARWREIVLDLPGLWAHLSFTLGGRDANLANVLRLYLSRSLRHPLSFEILDGPEDGWGQGYYHDRAVGRGGRDIWKMLRAVSFRWGSLELADLDYRYLRDLFEDVKELPMLERLCVDGTEQMYTLRSEEGLLPVSHRLRHLELVRRRRRPFELHLDSMPWDTIQHLEVEYDGAGDLDSVLEALLCGVSLKTLCFKGVATYNQARWFGPAPYQFQEDLYDPRVVSYITSLTFSFSGEDGFCNLLHDFMGSLVVPQLTDLELHFSPDASRWSRRPAYLAGVGWPHHALETCFKRSGLQLTTLCMNGMAITDVELLMLLRICPALHTFRFHELFTDPLITTRPATSARTITKHVLDELILRASRTGVSSGNVLLPRLRTLELSVRTHFDADASFVNLIESRWARDSADCLRTAVLRVSGRRLSDEVYDSLGTIREEGMLIDISGGGERVV